MGTLLLCADKSVTMNYHTKCSVMLASYIHSPHPEFPVSHGVRILCAKLQQFSCKLPALSYQVSGISRVIKDQSYFPDFLGSGNHKFNFPGSVGTLSDITNFLGIVFMSKLLIHCIW